MRTHPLLLLEGLGGFIFKVRRHDVSFLAFFLLALSYIWLYVSKIRQRLWMCRRAESLRLTTKNRSDRFGSNGPQWPGLLNPLFYPRWGAFFSSNHGCTVRSREFVTSKGRRKVRNDSVISLLFFSSWAGFPCLMPGLHANNLRVWASFFHSYVPLILANGVPSFPLDFSSILWRPLSHQPPSQLFSPGNLFLFSNSEFPPQSLVFFVRFSSILLYTIFCFYFFIPERGR